MISIIIPTYNNLDYLKICLDSIKKNSVYNHEIILHINEGVDGTLKFAEDNNIAFALIKGKYDQVDDDTVKPDLDIVLKDMKNDLSKVQDLLHNLDKDRKEQYSKLDQKLKFAAEQTNKLQESTSQLNIALSGTKTRGQWGERMVEDILDFIGFMEDKNYTKQSQVDSGEKPDYTFLLPKEKKLNMDVKFPIAHYEEYLATDDEKLRLAAKKQFLADIRNHVRAVSQRS